MNGGTDLRKTDKKVNKWSSMRKKMPHGKSERERDDQTTNEGYGEGTDISIHLLCMSLRSCMRHKSLAYPWKALVWWPPSFNSTLPREKSTLRLRESCRQRIPLMLGPSFLLPKRLCHPSGWSINWDRAYDWPRIQFRRQRDGEEKICISDLGFRRHFCMFPVVGILASHIHHSSKESSTFRIEETSWMHPLKVSIYSSKSPTNWV